MRKISLLIISSFLTLPVFADSAYQPGDYYIAPGVAYYHFSDKRDLQNAAMADLTAGYVVNQHFSLEALYGQVVTEPTPNTDQPDTRFYAYWVDGVYHFQPNAEKQNSFYPYLLGGIGITNQNNDAMNSGNTILASVNAGAGLEYFINPKISFFTDVRDVYTMSGGKNDWMLNAGIKFVFDGEKTAPATVSAPEATETTSTSGFYELQETTQHEG